MKIMIKRLKKTNYDQERELGNTDKNTQHLSTINSQSDKIRLLKDKKYQLEKTLDKNAEQSEKIVERTYQLTEEIISVKSLYNQKLEAKGWTEDDFDAHRKKREIEEMKDEARKISKEIERDDKKWR